MKLQVMVKNEGYLPTNITQRALDAEIAVPVRITINLVNAEFESGQSRTVIGHLKGTRDSEPGSDENASHHDWVVRLTGQNPKAIITVSSEKGGSKTHEMELTASLRWGDNNR